LSGEIGNSKRFLSITGGNLRNRHLYISGYHDFFPAECYGQSSARKGTGRKLTLVVEGLAQPVETDIATASGNGRPRGFFRKRAWVGRFFERHHLREEDTVTIERLDRFTYRVYPSGGRTIGAREPNNPMSKVPHTCGQTRLFPDTSDANRPSRGKTGFGDTAFTKNRNEPLHRWVPWIAGFSGAFVEEVLKSASPVDPSTVTVLDPFVGVGTTLVEGLMRGHNVVGFEINPYAALASDLKVSCIRQKLSPLEEALEQLDGFSTRLRHGKARPKSWLPGGARAESRSSDQRFNCPLAPALYRRAERPFCERGNLA